jgi:hypothetical protein
VIELKVPVIKESTKCEFVGGDFDLKNCFASNSLELSREKVENKL